MKSFVTYKITKFINTYQHVFPQRTDTPIEDPLCILHRRLFVPKQKPGHIFHMFKYVEVTFRLLSLETD